MSSKETHKSVVDFVMSYDGKPSTSDIAGALCLNPQNVTQIIKSSGIGNLVHGAHW